MFGGFDRAGEKQITHFSHFLTFNSYNHGFLSRLRIVNFFLRKNQLLKMFSIVVSTMKVFRQNILGNVKIYKSI